jgi:hypothetical protein
VVDTLEEVEPSSERATPPRAREPHTIASASISSAADRIAGHWLMPDAAAAGSSVSPAVSPAATPRLAMSSPASRAS